jgi:sugar lactone lactonase YvrE
MGNVLNPSFAQKPAGGLNGPRGMIFDQAGNLYVSCKNSNKVEQYDPTGAYLGDFVTSGLGGLSGPRGIVFGPDGNLYVASFGDVGPTNGTGILRYDGKTGAFIDTFTKGDNGMVSTGINGFTFGPDGKLYVSRAGQGSILQYDSGGNFQSAFVDPTANGGLSDPNGVLFDGQGNLYVCDLGNGGVLQYDKTGAFVQFFVYPQFGCPGPPIGQTSYMCFTETNPVTLLYGR